MTAHAHNRVFLPRLPDRHGGGGPMRQDPEVADPYLVGFRSCNAGGVRWRGGEGQGGEPSMRNNEINQQIMAAQPHQLCTLIAARKAEFDHVHMATAFRKLLQSRRDGVPHRVVERALQALEESALEKIEDFQSKQLATTLHAMAKDRYHPSNPRVLEALEQQAAATASTFNAQEVRARSTRRA